MADDRRGAYFLEPDVFSDWLIQEAEKRFCRVDSPEKAEVLFTRVGYRLDRDLLECMPLLKVIASPTTGVDHIDWDECERRRIDVLTLKGETALLESLTNTAEHAFALLLALYRRVVPAYLDVMGGRWSQADHRGRTVEGRTLGIVGYGRLGRIAGRIGRGFGMNVLAYDPYVDIPAAEAMSAGTIGELAARSDVVSLHAALNNDNDGLVDFEVLARMPEQAVLINTARGQLVDEPALLGSLERGEIAGAALDVIRCETAFGEDNALLAYARHHDNLLLTPHIGGQTREAVQAADQFILSKLENWCVDNDR